MNSSFVVDIGARPLVFKNGYGYQIAEPRRMKTYNSLHRKTLLFRSNDSTLNEEFVFAFRVQRRILFQGLKHD